MSKKETSSEQPKIAVARGRAKSPYLFVMTHAPSAAMLGWFFRSLLHVGIRKTDVRLVFMINGKPVNSGNKPSKGQLREARDRFEAELLASKPEVICPMGTEAFFAVTGINESILDARGYVIRKHLFHTSPREVWKSVGIYKAASKATGKKKGDHRMKWVKEDTGGPFHDFDGVVIPVFTLDYVRTSQFDVAPAFTEDLRRARRAALGKLEELTMDVLITDEADLPSVEAWGDLVAIDIETHGVDNEVIDLVSFSDGDKTAALPWTEKVRQYVEDLFCVMQPRLFCVHNSPFDIPRLRSNGVNIPQDVIEKNVIDTMFGAVILQPDLHKGLGRVASLYLDIAPWKTASRKDTSHWRIMVKEDAVRYAGKDAFHTHWLGRQIITVMKDLGVWKLFMGGADHPGPGVMATIPVLTDMSLGGLKLSKDKALKLCLSLEKRQFQYLKLWTRMFPNIRFASNPQLNKLFYTEWGLPIQRAGTNNSVSVNELAMVSLKYFVADNRTNKEQAKPWQTDPRCVPRTFDLMLKIRDVSKSLSTYIQPALLNAETWVHPSYLPASKDDERGGKKMDSKGTTATGRLAAFKPNIMNQPKKLRVLYVPDNEGMCFVQADYKSAELYVLAGMSGDDVLLDDLKHDLHQRNADRHGIDRDTAKSVTYATQYLASPGKASEMILVQTHKWVSPATCLAVSNAIWGHYTDAAAYKQLLIEMCQARMLIQNPIGRIRFFHAGKAPAAVDFIPQSTVADILWCVMKDVADIAKACGGRLVTTVHDSLLICVPANMVMVAAQAMKLSMERRFDCVRKGFFIPVEIEAGAPGASWGELKPLEVELATSIGA